MHRELPLLPTPREMTPAHEAQFTFVLVIASAVSLSRAIPALDGLFTSLRGTERLVLLS